MKKYYVYILQCKDRSFYVGLTRHFRKRIQDHKSGNGCLYTKNRIPIRLVYFEKYTDFYEAKLRENQIKGWSQKKKINLIKYKHPNGNFAGIV